MSVFRLVFASSSPSVRFALLGLFEAKLCFCRYLWLNALCGAVPNSEHQVPATAHINNIYYRLPLFFN